ncbi:DedA family protein [Chitinolyticbacter albus]|uniref:DedA family protein n=1 Tax=Chitinolyticbacter albus TaxID=2961951 RepID=UPI0027E461B6|nr:DedA family protein [Chitinolyticbacter albus]
MAYLVKHEGTAWLALLLATVGNSVGGAISVWLGRRLPRKETPARAAWLQRHGPWVLLLSWVPLVGDALCVAAGWLRWPWRKVWPALVAGKLLRYLAVIASVEAVI